MSEVLTREEPRVSAPTSVRKFADLVPGLIEECQKYMRASKWYNLETMDREMMRTWIPQFSLWTRSTFKVRGHVYANCPHPELRLALLEVVGEEDIVDPRVGMNHRQLLATSLGKAAGFTLAELGEARPLPTTLVTFNLLFGIANRSWQEGIALASGLERMLQECGYFKFEARRAQRDLGWTDEEVAWFTGHDEADVEHGAVIDLLDKYVTDDRTWDMVREAILEAWVAWWILFDGVVDAQKQGIKTVTGAGCKGLSTVF